MNTTTTTSRYVEPGAVTRRVMNPLVRGVTSLGLSIKGSRILEVPGRNTGQLRSTVVNVLTVDGSRYLVSPRGQSQWVRNLRAAGSATLRLGTDSETFTAVEVPDDEKPPLLRAYLEAWAWEVGRFVDGLTASSAEEEFSTAAPGFPVFRVV